MQVSKLATLLLVSSAAAFAQGAGYWHTNGVQILDSNNLPVRIAGINWYGFETTDEVVHGLYDQDYKSILNTIHGNGYNVIRLPFSNQMVETPIIPSDISYTNSTGPINTPLQGLNSLQIMDQVISYAGQIGLRVILDNHRSEAGNSAESNGLWYTTTYPETAWINDWTTLVTRYKGNTTVIGVDLRNEPHNANSGGSCWGCGSSTNDWRLAAERGGDAVQAVNPSLLLFVEGTDCYNNDCDWWGGNLEGAQQYPVTFNTASHLVYSAHDYGPNEYQQSWFNGSTTDATLISVWTKFWAYLSLNGTAPTWLGEFGTTNNNSDIEDTSAGSQGQWFQSLVGFLQSNSSLSWTYWALNGEDNYGLLDSNYDPTPANSLKQQLLATIQFPLSSGGGGGGKRPTAPSNLIASTFSNSQIDLSWTASTTSGVTYDVYSSTTSGFKISSADRIATSVSGTTYPNAGLNASTTYYYLVTATSAKAQSKPSNQASATTQSSGGGGGGDVSCHVTYTDQNDWGSGFTGGISIANTGTSPINNWILTWTWPGNQSMTQSWNATYSQSGETVTLTNMSYNATIPAGGNQTGIGFNANYSGDNNPPAAVPVKRHNV